MTKSHHYLGKEVKQLECLCSQLSLGSGAHIFNCVDGPGMSTKASVEYIRQRLGMTGKMALMPLRFTINPLQHALGGIHI